MHCTRVSKLSLTCLISVYAASNGSGPHFPRPVYTLVPTLGAAQGRYEHRVPIGGSSGTVGACGQPVSRIHFSLGHSATHATRFPPRDPCRYCSCSSDLQKHSHLHALLLTSARVFCLFEEPCDMDSSTGCDCEVDISIGRDCDVVVTALMCVCMKLDAASGWSCIGVAGSGNAAGDGAAGDGAARVGSGSGLGLLE
jgi:hypothetical protein